jgi:hypothetical protein
MYFIYKSNGGVCLCGQCLEDSSNHCPFHVECFGRWGKGEPGEARGEGAKRGGGGRQGGGGGEHGRGRTDGCIMHRVHTSEGPGWLEWRSHRLPTSKTLILKTHVSIYL